MGLKYELFWNDTRKKNKANRAINTKIQPAPKREWRKQSVSRSWLRTRPRQYARKADCSSFLLCGDMAVRDTGCM